MLHFYRGWSFSIDTSLLRKYLPIQNSISQDRVQHYNEQSEQQWHKLAPTSRFQRVVPTTNRRHSLLSVTDANLRRNKTNILARRWILGWTPLVLWFVYMLRYLSLVYKVPPKCGREPTHARVCPTSYHTLPWKRTFAYLSLSVPIIRCIQCLSYH